MTRRSPTPSLDVLALHKALDSAREQRGLSWRGVAGETHVSPSTFSRMKEERKPDADSLSRLLDWLNMPAEHFIRDSGKNRPAASSRATTTTAITAALRADPQLTDQDVEFVVEALNAAYRYVRASKTKG